MAEKKKDKEPDLMYGAQPVDPDAVQANDEQQAAAEHQHESFVENIEVRRCPYHGQDIKVQSEKRVVKKLDKEGRETNDYKEITVHYAICTCVVPGGVNPYRGKRVWEQT